MATGRPECAAPADEGVTDEDNSKMEVWWNKAMCAEMDIPEGYQNVAVLIIKWIEELDELKTGDEVSEPFTRMLFLSAHSYT